MLPASVLLGERLQGERFELFRLKTDPAKFYPADPAERYKFSKASELDSHFAADFFALPDRATLKTAGNTHPSAMGPGRREFPFPERSLRWKVALILSPSLRRFDRSQPPNSFISSGSTAV